LSKYKDGDFFKEKIQSGFDKINIKYNVFGGIGAMQIEPIPLVVILVIAKGYRKVVSFQ